MSNVKRLKSTGKIGYTDKESANNALFSMLRRQKKKGYKRVTTFNVYGCKCGKFHIGKSKGIEWEQVDK